MAEERLKLAVFIDFDNVQIGVKDTLGKEFDVALVLEALKERGEVVTKVAYGDWHRAGDHSRQMAQHAVQMVQRNVTPGGDKNGADINLALDAFEMAFTRDHINAFAIVGGDSDFIALVEKLKQYGKRVFVVGGRAFTSHILQRNCTEFIAYENLLKSGSGGNGSRGARAPRRGAGSGRASLEARPLSAALPNVERALKVLAEREVAPQLGLLKSTILQLDSTFSERDYGAGSFLEFMQKMERAGLVRLHRTDRSYLVELANGETTVKSAGSESEPSREAEGAPEPALLSLGFGGPASGEESREIRAPAASGPAPSGADAMETLKRFVGAQKEKAPNRPIYLRQIRQALRPAGKSIDGGATSRAVFDLLHRAQDEGFLKLVRDRKGILRIFPVIGSAPTVPPAASNLGQEETGALVEELTSPEATASGEVPASEEIALATPALLEPPLPTDETSLAEDQSGHRTRKPRSAPASGKRTRRKSSGHRKSKDRTGD